MRNGTAALSCFYCTCTTSEESLEKKRTLLSIKKCRMRYIWRDENVPRVPHVRSLKCWEFSTNPVSQMFNLTNIGWIAQIQEPVWGKAQQTSRHVSPHLTLRIRSPCLCIAFLSCRWDDVAFCLSNRMHMGKIRRQISRAICLPDRMMHMERKYRQTCRAFCLSSRVRMARKSRQTSRAFCLPNRMHMERKCRQRAAYVAKT